jgi:hypothetical protein
MRPIKSFSIFPRMIAVCSVLACASAIVPSPIYAQDSTKQTTTKSASNHPSEQDIVNAKSQGLVWVNTSTRVYHKGGDNYGKTKHGKFMTEAEARQQGFKEAKEPAGGAPIPHKNDQSGIDASPKSHSSTPSK